MIKIDLVSGFLGSGKTTFIKGYVRYLKRKGYKVGIIENDFSPINVDLMNLASLEDENCRIEQVVGGYRIEDYKRRMKAKLIAFKLDNFTHVVIEPSGLFDIDSFFDVIDDDNNLSNWYQVNNIITVIDVSNNEVLNKEEKYLFLSQLISSGSILYSKLDLVNKETLVNKKEEIKKELKEAGSNKLIDVVSIDKNILDLNDGDYERIFNSTYSYIDIPHTNINLENDFDNLFIMDESPSLSLLINNIKILTSSKEYGDIIRIKGFIKDNGEWYSVNYSSNKFQKEKIDVGQDVIIVIGTSLKEEKIKNLFKK